jgi:hypothetical protein
MGTTSSKIVTATSPAPPGRVERTSASTELFTNREAVTDRFSEDCEQLPAARVASPSNIER